MALNAYLKLKGQQQGDIKGLVTRKGREGTIEVIEANHEIVSPRDAASGLPTGKLLWRECPRFGHSLTIIPDNRPSCSLTQPIVLIAFSTGKPV